MPEGRDLYVIDAAPTYLTAGQIAVEIYGSSPQGRRAGQAQARQAGGREWCRALRTIGSSTEAPGIEKQHYYISTVRR